MAFTLFIDTKTELEASKIKKITKNNFFDASNRCIWACEGQQWKILKEIINIKTYYQDFNPDELWEITAFCNILLFSKAVNKLLTEYEHTHFWAGNIIDNQYILDILQRTRIPQTTHKKLTKLILTSPENMLNFLALGDTIYASKKIFKQNSTLRLSYTE